MESLEQKEHQTILTQSSNSETVPEDLISEIPLRLPTKSIARFRCVSKIWASILSRQDFTEKFLTRSFAKPPIFFACGRENGKLLFFSSPLQPQNTNDYYSLSIAPNYQMNLPAKLVWTVIHINGLVCIREGVFAWKICNPSTRQYFTLPGVKIERFSWVTTFFGYDPIETQVKVLTITGEVKDNAISNDVHQVLTLETGKMSWRRIECGTPHSPIYVGVCIGGVLYYRSLIIFCLSLMLHCYSSIPLFSM